jgi:hypothetical protein
MRYRVNQKRRRRKIIGRRSPAKPTPNRQRQAWKRSLSLS